MTPPFSELAYLYVATADFEKSLVYYRDVLGGRVVWNLEGFGAHVAAVELGPGPLVLLADHRKPPNVLPVYAVKSLSKTTREFKGRGWKPHGERFEIPNGPCHLFLDPSGNEYAIFENVRPHPFEGEGRES